MTEKNPAEEVTINDIFSKDIEETSEEELEGLIQFYREKRLKYLEEEKQAKLKKMNKQRKQLDSKLEEEL